MKNLITKARRALSTRRFRKLSRASNNMAPQLPPESGITELAVFANKSAPAGEWEHVADEKITWRGKKYVPRSFPPYVMMFKYKGQPQTHHIPPEVVARRSGVNTVHVNDANAIANKVAGIIMGIKRSEQLEQAQTEAPTYGLADIEY